MFRITNELLGYRNFRKYGDIFVETGSAAGDGIQRSLDAGFPVVYSIEAAQVWYDLCLTRFREESRVKLHLGLSTDVLSELDLPQSQVVFFLDAHPSGPLSAGHDDVMAFGSESPFYQDNIIKAELGIILNKYARPIIIIDDQRIDDTSLQYIKILQDADPSYHFEFYDENLSGTFLYKNKLLVARYE
jgi:hypothetical protein